MIKKLHENISTFISTLHNDTKTESAPADKNALGIPITPSAFTCPRAESQEPTTTFKAGDMFSVLGFFGKISMYSFLAKPDYIGTGKENMNAKNPADADPCVAK